MCFGCLRLERVALGHAQSASSWRLNVLRRLNAKTIAAMESNASRRDLLHAPAAAQAAAAGNASIHICREREREESVPLRPVGEGPVGRDTQSGMPLPVATTDPSEEPGKGRAVGSGTQWLTAPGHVLVCVCRQSEEEYVHTTQHCGLIQCTVALTNNTCCATTCEQRTGAQSALHN